MHHGALEAMLGDGALELVGGGLWIVRRQRGKRREARGMGGTGCRQPVVDATHQRSRAVGRQLLRRGRTMGDDLDVDTGLVHLLDPNRAEIVETLELRTGAA